MFTNASEQSIKDGFTPVHFETLNNLYKDNFVLIDLLSVFSSFFCKFIALEPTLNNLMQVVLGDSDSNLAKFVDNFNQRYGNEIEHP